MSEYEIKVINWMIGFLSVSIVVLVGLLIFSHC
jgi:hypothetical protein